EYTDAHVAAILNERGLRTGAGAVFDSESVRWVRFSAGLESLKKRLLGAGMLTSKQMAARLGVSRTTLGIWRRQGRLQARICNDQGQWLYWPPSDERPADTEAPDRRLAAGARDSSAVRGAVWRRVPSRSTCLPAPNAAGGCASLPPSKTWRSSGGSSPTSPYRGNARSRCP